MFAGCQEKNSEILRPGEYGAGRGGEALPGYTRERPGGVKGKWVQAEELLSHEEARFTSGEASGKTSTFPLTEGGKTAIFRTDRTASWRQVVCLYGRGRPRIQRGGSVSRCRNTTGTRRIQTKPCQAVI
jgi:hypothetical protein